MVQYVDAHETAYRVLCFAPDGSGRDSICHSFPFHVSASAVGDTISSPEVPTAIHAVVELQDTPRRMLSFAPDGAGTDTVDHSVPFQLSEILADGAPRVPPLLPTAMHDVVDMHATPDRLALDIFAVFCVLHSVPFQRSASGSPLNPVPPTAVQALLDVHDMPPRLPLPGVVTTFHSVPFQLSASVMDSNTPVTF